MYLSLLQQAVKEPKQNCQVSAVPAKPLSVPEDNDAGSSSSKAVIAHWIASLTLSKISSLEFSWL